VGVIDIKDYLIGIFTDGDLLRCFNKTNLDKPINELMHLNPMHVNKEMLELDLLKVL